jgi:tRNA pseudouridine55 synthase
VLVVDKPRGLTSHDVVAQARRALRTREIGHSGTLDPMATGVLVLVVGEATKLVAHLTAATKVYEATLRLGQATDSLDADGRPTEERPVPALSLEQVRAVAAGFVGEIEQRVPAVSAIKLAGKPLYARARAGQVPAELPSRRVRLDALEVTAQREGELDLWLRCGKGFYVRALGRDLAAALGTVGHLSALRRLHNGFCSLEQAVEHAWLRAAAQGDEAARAQLRARLLPLDDVAWRLNRVILSEVGVDHARHGRPIPRSEVLGESLAPDHDSPVRVAFDAQGRAVALVEPRATQDAERSAQPAGEPSSGAELRVLRGFRRD